MSGEQAEKKFKRGQLLICPYESREVEQKIGHCLFYQTGSRCLINYVPLYSQSALVFTQCYTIHCSVFSQCNTMYCIVFTQCMLEKCKGSVFNQKQWIARVGAGWDPSMHESKYRNIKL